VVSDTLSDSLSKVNGPFVPTVTSPLMVLVTLLNVVVAPSLTSWAWSDGTVHSTRATNVVDVFMVLIFEFLCQLVDALRVVVRFFRAAAPPAPPSLLREPGSWEDFAKHRFAL
jgi:hypothetical protein